MEKLIDMYDVVKTFPGVRALDGAKIDLYEGEVHVLMGENGAGKSTFMKVLTGIYKKNEGNIKYLGKELNVSSPKEAEAIGISIIYQEFNLLPHLTVAENIFIAKEPTNSFGLINYKKMNEDARKILKNLNLDIEPETKVSELKVGHQQMVEIAKATSVKAKVLIMDEPTAALTEREIKELFKVIKDLRSKGVGIIYISHRMEELQYIADRITVMRDGKHIDTMRYEDTTIEEIIEKMVGRSLGGQYPEREKVESEVILEVKNLNREGVVSNINFDLRKGEILGFAGLMGAGRTEVAKLIFGYDKKDSGEIILDGKEVKINSPIDAINNRIVYLTEDRKKDGIFAEMSVEDNIMVSNLDISSKKFTFYDPKMAQKICKKAILALNIKTPSLEQKIKNLSGGNQQKVILARWTTQEQKVLIIDEPTRGIDVGAKKEIYYLMKNLAAKGTSIIMISSELPEVLGMSDRVVVMQEGKISKILENDSNLTQEKIMYYATSEIKEENCGNDTGEARK